MDMLNAALCLVGVFILLVVSENLTIKGRYKGELVRKFTHITVGIFVASWPWITTAGYIELMGLVMAGVVYFNRHYDLFRFNKNLQRETLGDYFFAVAITLCALFTASRIFFAIAILNLAMADGLAAVMGRRYGNRLKYKFFNQTKTLLGTMTFWLVSLLIFGVGALFAKAQIDIHGYLLLIVLAPPVMTFLENASPYGLDNLIVPIATLGALHLAASF